MRRRPEVLVAALAASTLTYCLVDNPLVEESYRCEKDMECSLVSQEDPRASGYACSSKGFCYARVACGGSACLEPQVCANGGCTEDHQWANFLVDQPPALEDAGAGLRDQTTKLLWLPEAQRLQATGANSCPTPWRMATVHEVLTLVTLGPGGATLDPQVALRMEPADAGLGDGGSPDAAPWLVTLTGSCTTEAPTTTTWCSGHRWTVPLRDARNLVVDTIGMDCGNCWFLCVRGPQ